MSIVLLLNNTTPSVQTMFVEPILDEIESVLSAGMADQISGISDEYSDFELDDIVEYYIGNHTNFPQFPVIEIIPENSPGDEYDAYSLMVSHTIQIRVWAVDDDETRLQRRIWRYQRAITELLKADHTLGGEVSMIKFVSHSYEPMETTDYGAYIYGGSVTVEIDNEETTR